MCSRAILRIARFLAFLVLLQQGYKYLRKKCNFLSLSYVRQELALKINSTFLRPKFKLITIRSERHSGSSWLRLMINRNCPNLTFHLPHKWPLDADGKYGWKHGLLNSNFQLESEDFMIFLFRNWTSWLHKMRQNTYEKIPPNTAGDFWILVMGRIGWLENQK